MTPHRRRVALVLDEMFSPDIATELRRREHDVVAVAADPRLRAMTDAELCAWARTEGRRIVTENVKDFRRLMAADLELAGPGVLYSSSRTFARSRRAPGSLIGALDQWLRQPDVANRSPEDWLSPATSR